MIVDDWRCVCVLFIICHMCAYFVVVVSLVIDLVAGFPEAGYLGGSVRGMSGR